MLKFRMHRCGTIVCFFNDTKGFAISVGSKDIDVFIGRLDNFNFYIYPDMWVEI